MRSLICSTLIHKLGGFFIRRRLDETPDGRKDILYRALLHGVRMVFNFPRHYSVTESDGAVLELGLLQICSLI